MARPVEALGPVSPVRGSPADGSITLAMIPKEMLHQKPIDLRHVCLFYIGHM